MSANGSNLASPNNTSTTNNTNDSKNIINNNNNKNSRHENDKSGEIGLDRSHTILTHNSRSL